jgi:hypothetical protein
VAKGKELVLHVKNGKFVLPAGETAPVSAADFVVRLIKALPVGHPLHGLFGADYAIVPAPGHSLIRSGAKTPLGLLAERMAHARLGDRYEDIVRRTVAVPKMSLQPPGGRFDYLQHLDTIEARPIVSPAGGILVLDDVVTTGATMYATCLAIAKANPGVKVRAFGISRTDQTSASFLFGRVGLLGPSGLNV